MNEHQDRTAPRGRIDEVDLASFDVVEFNGGVNPWEPVRSVHSSFKPGPAPFRRSVREWGFDGLGSVIDLGCGYGRWSMFLAEANDRLVGLERNAAGVELCRKLAAHFALDNAEFAAGDVRDVPWPDASFDGAWCNNVVQFVDRGKLLDECRRLLEPGGSLFLGVANSTGRVLEKFFAGYAKGGLAHNTTRWALTSLRQGPLDDGRPNYTTLETIGETLERHGLELVTCRRRDKSGRGVELQPDTPFQEELHDLPALAARLESDERLAAELARHPQLANAFPQHVEALARKPL